MTTRVDDLDGQELLKAAEELASRHLHRHGIRLLENNWSAYLKQTNGAMTVAPEFAKYCFTLGFVSGAIQKFR